MIDSKKLARIRRRVVGGYLHGLGIEPSKREYLAKVGPQLRYVSFGRGYSKNFDVSIALHFDFLPPFALAVWPGAPVPAEMCSELCAFQRLVRSHSGSQYYEYGETEAAAAEMLGDIAVSPQFWLNLQSAYDLRVAESLSGSERHRAGRAGYLRSCRSACAPPAVESLRRSASITKSTARESRVESLV